jgi:FKBP-type peptidyl-prolyl cis-trans isomerase FklB
MKTALISLIVVVLCAGMAAAQDNAATPPADKEMAAYGFGYLIGRDLNGQGLNLNPDQFLQGMRDGITGATPRHTEEELRAALQAFQKEMMAKQEKEQQALAENNKKAGDAFLAENKKKEGVITTESGLQYKILTAGTGAQPKAEETVVVNYRGTLIDGTEFDSSAGHGSPATFPVNAVIQGWTEALQLMKVGSKWQIVLPPELAYGPGTAGPKIGPNSTLVFDVELLSIEKPAPPEKETAPAKEAAPAKEGTQAK